MPGKRWVLVGSATVIGGGVFAATAGAQSAPPGGTPGPPPPGPAPAAVYPGGPRPGIVCETGGPVRRAFRHTWGVLKDNFVGYPQEFVEPPPGFYTAEVFGLMKTKGNPHKFILYRSDFLAGSDRLSPMGASRFNQMSARLKGWPGPVVVEWSPDEPGLAEARRLAVLTMLQGIGQPVIPERVVVGPSPYPGLFGTDAANNYTVMTTRDVSAPSQFSLSPSSGGGFSGGSGGGTP